jgi:hypothetical protein
LAGRLPPPGSSEPQRFSFRYGKTTAEMSLWPFGNAGVASVQRIATSDVKYVVKFAVCY